MLALRCAIKEDKLKAESLKDEDRTLFDKFTSIPTEMLAMVHPTKATLAKAFAEVGDRYDIRFGMVTIG